MALIKSISGFRGTIGGAVGDNLTPIDLVKFTAAFTQFIKEGQPSGAPTTIVVGRDARISGAMCAQIVEGTLLACGANVINIGLATTPTVELAVTTHKASGGIILTASHNPKQWNALKLLGANGEFLTAKQGARVLEIAADESFTFVDIESIGSVISRESFDAQHIDMVLGLKQVDRQAISKRHFKVVLDAVNSVGGVVMPILLRALGCEVVELNCTPNGCFAHNPEPLPEHLTEISARVVAEKADLGVVVDPDVDRLALICADGTMFGEEYTLVAVADYILGLQGGNTCSNLSSSRALADIATRHGGSYAPGAVGEVNVVAKMKETGAVIGGEGNGGVIFGELHYGRDALVGVALFLTYLAHTGMTAKALRATLPSYFMSKNKIQLTENVDVDDILARMALKYKDEKVTTIDGVKIDLADGWVHLRKSNTEPIIRIYSEGPTLVRAEELAQMIITQIKAIIA
ncbi:MAG: phosphoglucosamine mutase [Mucinivorans sp.]